MRIPYSMHLETDDGLSFVNDVEFELEVTVDFINEEVRSVDGVYRRVYKDGRDCGERELLHEPDTSLAYWVGILAFARAEADPDLFALVKEHTDEMAAKDARRINELRHARVLS